MVKPTRRHEYGGLPREPQTDADDSKEPEPQKPGGVFYWLFGPVIAGAVVAGYSLLSPYTIWNAGGKTLTGAALFVLGLFAAVTIMCYPFALIELIKVRWVRAIAGVMVVLLAAVIVTFIVIMIVDK